MPEMVSTVSMWSIGDVMAGQGTAFSSAAWPSANRALFIPFTVTESTAVARMFWVNGATASNNVDCGIYNQDATTLLVSTGSTAMSGANVAQGVDVSARLAPGRYYLAAAMNGTTGTMMRNSTGGAEYLQRYGVLQAATNFPLASTPTLAVIASAYVPLIGFSQRAGQP